MADKPLTRDLYQKRERNEQGHLKHICCNGARFHVMSWSTKGRHCSEPECEVNFERVEGRKRG